MKINPLLTLQFKGTPPVKLIVAKVYTHEDSVNASPHSEFQVAISILVTVSEELATLL